jgi:hypothetical protein
MAFTGPAAKHIQVHSRYATILVSPSCVRFDRHVSTADIETTKQMNIRIRIPDRFTFWNLVAKYATDTIRLPWGLLRNYLFPKASVMQQTTTQSSAFLDQLFRKNCR